MKNISELKRIKVGTELNLIFSKFPWKNNIKLPVKRIVRHVQSNALTFEAMPEIGLSSPSWLYFPKASDFVGTEKGFQILDGDGSKLLEYEVA